MMSPPSVPSLIPLHEWSSLRTELIWIYDRAVHPSMQRWKAPGEEPPGYRAWLIRQGSVTIKTRSREFTVGAGQWIMPVKKASEVSFSSNAQILSVHFLCQWPSGENLLSGWEGRRFKSAHYPRLEKLAQGLQRHLQKQFPEKGAGEHIYNRRSSSVSDFLHFQTLFLQWLTEWVRIQMELGARLTRLRSGDDRPFRTARHLNLAPLDGGFPKTDLQKETGLGLMRLNQLFLSEFGFTARKYWDRRRLEFAKQCLETSTMPMKEIACRLGFRSDSHFVVWFRRFSGSRPGDYRKKYRLGSVVSGLGLRKK